ncbi:hypothetical protein [Aureliella helgolandensis]|uniref:hypothetical protein n=1 Tax=Aureliella helgolandensis TaxID=2527968 RepID=UPI0011AA3038|nr:hypothetical protein [Aureliella helgolandensis]
MLVLLAIFGANQVSAGVVTSNVIFGTGVTNGSFTVAQAGGVELGLRAKLRYNAAGNPENTFNEIGPGKYAFDPGVAPTQPATRGVWSYEWSINSDFDGTSGFKLDDLTYSLSMTSTNGASLAASDIINQFPFNPFADHAIGNSSTAEGAGTVANLFNYNNLIANNTLAQNSWRADLYANNYDPTLTGTYTYTLSAFHNGNQVVSTSIDVLVGVVPEPTSLMIFSSMIGMMIVPFRHRRK